MLYFSVIIGIIVLIQAVLSLSSYIRTGINEFIFMFLSELVQVFALSFIVKALTLGFVDISYKSIVFYCNLCIVYFYFKACLHVGSRNVTFNKGTTKNIIYCAFTSMFYVFLPCFEVMRVGIKDAEITANVVSSFFLEGFYILCPVEMNYLWAFLAFQIGLYITSLVISMLNSSKKRDLLTYFGQFFGLVVQIILFTNFGGLASKIIPVLYVLLCFTAILGNFYEYYRENYSLTFLIEMLRLYKKDKISKSQVKSAAYSYAMKTKNYRFIEKLFQLFRIHDIKLDFKDFPY